MSILLTDILLTIKTKSRKNNLYILLIGSGYIILFGIFLFSYLKQRIDEITLYIVGLWIGIFSFFLIRKYIKSYIIGFLDIYITKKFFIFFSSIFGIHSIQFEDIEKILLIKTEGDILLNQDTKTLFLLLKQDKKIPLLLQKKQKLPEIFIDHHTDNLLRLKDKIKNNEVLIIPHCINHKDIFETMEKQKISISTSI